MEIGALSVRARPSMTGITRRISSSSGTPVLPGRVDSPPISITSAPCRSNSRARAPLFERVACNQRLDLRCVERFTFEQRFRDTNQCVAIFLQDRLRPLVCVRDELMNFLIDGNSGVLAVITMLGDLSSQEDLFFLL